MVTTRASRKRDSILGIAHRTRPRPFAFTTRIAERKRIRVDAGTFVPRQLVVPSGDTSLFRRKHVAVAVNPVKPLVAVAWDGVVEIRHQSDVAKGRGSPSLASLVWKVPTPGNHVVDMSFSVCGNKLVICADRVYLWDMESGATTVLPFSSRVCRVKCIHVPNADTSRAATRSAVVAFADVPGPDGVCAVEWLSDVGSKRSRLATFKLVMEHGDDDRVLCVEASLNGKRLAMGTQKGYVFVLSIDSSGKQRTIRDKSVTALARASPSPVHAIVWSGLSTLSAFTDSLALFLNISSQFESKYGCSISFKTLSTPWSSPVHGIAASPDKSRVAVIHRSVHKDKEEEEGTKEAIMVSIFNLEFEPSDTFGMNHDLVSIKTCEGAGAGVVAGASTLFGDRVAIAAWPDEGTIVTSETSESTFKHVCVSSIAVHHHHHHHAQ